MCLTRQGLVQTASQFVAAGNRATQLLRRAYAVEARSLRAGELKSAHAPMTSTPRHWTDCEKSQGAPNAVSLARMRCFAAQYPLTGAAVDLSRELAWVIRLGESVLVVSTCVLLHLDFDPGGGGDYTRWWYSSWRPLMGI